MATIEVKTLLEIIAVLLFLLLLVAFGIYDGMCGVSKYCDHLWKQELWEAKERQKEIDRVSNL